MSLLPLIMYATMKAIKLRLSNKGGVKEFLVLLQIPSPGSQHHAQGPLMQLAIMTTCAWGQTFNGQEASGWTSWLDIEEPLSSLATHLEQTNK